MKVKEEIKPCQEEQAVVVEAAEARAEEAAGARVEEDEARVVEEAEAEGQGTAQEPPAG